MRGTAGMSELRRWRIPNEVVASGAVRDFALATAPAIAADEDAPNRKPVKEVANGRMTVGVKASGSRLALLWRASTPRTPARHPVP